MERVAIHGVPRSGTSWVGEILNSSPYTTYCFQPLFSYAMKGILTPSSSRQDIDAFFEKLRTTRDPFIKQEVKRQEGLLPVFAKKAPTHIVYKEVRYHNVLRNLMQKEPAVRLVAVVRNPMAVINSWLRAPREFRRDLGWLDSDEWRYALKKNLNKPEEYNGFEKWKEASATFVQLEETYPSRVLIVEYRSLLEGPESNVQRMLDFCSLGMTEQTMDFLRKSTATANGDPYSVYRSAQRDDAWKTELDAAISSQIIDDLRGSPLDRFLYAA